MPDALAGRDGVRMAFGLDRLTAREERSFTEVGLLDVGKERREGGVVPYGFDGLSA